MSMNICIIDHKGHALLHNHNIFAGLVVVCLQWFAAGPVPESCMRECCTHIFYLCEVLSFSPILLSEQEIAV